MIVLLLTYDNAFDGLKTKSQGVLLQTRYLTSQFATYIYSILLILKPNIYLPNKRNASYDVKACYFYPIGPQYEYTQTMEIS